MLTEPASGLGSVRVDNQLCPASTICGLEKPAHIGADGGFRVAQSSSNLVVVEPLPHELEDFPLDVCQILEIRGRLSSQTLAIGSEYTIAKLCREGRFIVYRSKYCACDSTHSISLEEITVSSSRERPVKGVLVRIRSQCEDLWPSGEFSEFVDYGRSISYWHAHVYEDDIRIQLSDLPDSDSSTRGCGNTLNSRESDQSSRQLLEDLGIIIDEDDADWRWHSYQTTAARGCAP